MTEYLFKVSLVIGVAYLFYKLLLQQESFFATNRIYLICSILIAFGLPFMQLPQLTSHQGFVSYWFQDEHSQPLNDVSLQQNGPVVQIDKEISSEASAIQSRGAVVEKGSTEAGDIVLPDNSFSWSFLLSMLYLFGVVIFTLNLLFQVGNLVYRIFKSAEKVEHEGFTIVNTKRKQAPCSFFKYIFIFPDDYDFSTYEQIIAHEKIHVRQGHSWDFLFAEIATIILWFNPFIWLYKKEVEKNIEFQTDTMLLDQERIDKSQYQISLLKIAIPYKPLSITTNYNQSLLKQRIMMMNAKKSTLNRYWKYAFTAPLFLCTVFMLNQPAKSQKNAVAYTGQTGVPQPEPIPQAEPALMPSPEPLVLTQLAIEDKVDMTRGVFYSYQRDNKYCIDFKGTDGEGRWNMTECFEKDIFNKVADEIFVMTRETGTLKLLGALDNDVSQGRYEFTKDINFEKYLTDKKIKADDNYLFHLHLHKVDRKYVDFLAQNFSNINGDQLLAMAIHDVGQKYIDELAKAGFKDLTPDKLIAAKIHNINPASIGELQALGFGDLNIDQLIALNIHEVNADFLEELQNAGFSKITFDEAISAKIHDLNAEAIQTIRSLGFNDLSVRKMTELQIHNIDAEFIQDLKESGFDNLTLDEALQASIHDLSAEAIRDIKALGFGDLSFGKMIELQIHDVDANYIEVLKSAGFTDLTIDQIVQAKIHDVDISDIKEMRSLGFKNINFEKIVQANIHNVNAAYLNDLKSVGFTGISIDKAIEAKIHGIDSNFIKEAKSKGYHLNTLDEYIRVKIHGLARNN